MEPIVFTLEEIIEILSSGEFEKLKGSRESIEFEFKSKKPYALDNKDNKDQKRNTLATAELAKDVASFANINGGIIVCGVIRKVDKGRDIVNGFDLLKEADFYKEQDILGRLNLTIFENLENISVKWFASKDDPTLGLGAIIIPKQKEDRKRFIVSICPAENTTLSGVYFGIPFRKDDKTDWYSIKELKFLRQMMPSTTEEQYMGIFKALGEIKDMLSSKGKSTDKLVELKKRMEQNNG